jgi:hypothetical protein
MPDDPLDILDDAWEPDPPSLFALVTECRDRLDQVLDTIDHGHDPARITAMIHQVVKLLLVATEP